jgi:2-hydroxy-6-oxonona-2,4-dienedioate hydrolase
MTPNKWSWAPFFLFAPTIVGATDCAIDSDALNRGEKKAFLICGEAITPAVELSGLAQANIDVLYRQPLRRCDVGDRRPGLFLVLRAGPDATDATIEVSDRLTRTPACDALSLKVGRQALPSDTSPPTFLDAMAEADAKFIDVDGVRTRYFDTGWGGKGEGDVLILVHGGQPSAADFNAWEWQQNFDGLSNDFRVIALDRIGQGETDNPADLDDYAEYYPLVVRHLYGFIRALGLERVHLVGHSQGGWPVTRLALDYPERVASLVIVDSTMVAPAANAAQAVRFYIYMQNELHPASGETLESIRRGMAYFSNTNNNITDQRVRRILALSQTAKYQAARDWFQTARMNPAHPSFRALKAEIWEELAAGALQVPTLIIWGREDPEGSFDAGVAFYEALAAAGTDVRFRAFDNAGHVPYMEYPGEFNRVVTEFIMERQ